MSVFLFNLLLIFSAPAPASGDSHGGGFLEFYNHYLNYPGFEAWRFLNLAIFVAIIIYLVKTPLSNAFKAKRETIRAELIKAEEEKQSALAQLTATEARIVNLDTEKQTIRDRAAQEAEAEKLRINEQTEFEVSKLREQAASEIERKNQQVRNELRKFSAEESIRLAEEKIKSEINADKDAQIIKANIQSIGGLN